MHQVVVTGIGVVLPGCGDRDRLWAQLRDGQSQLVLEPNPAGGNPVPMGRVRDFDPAAALAGIPDRFVRRYSREIQIYLASVLRARDDAGLDLDRVDPARIGLFDGVSRPAQHFNWELQREGRQVRKEDLLSGLPGQAVGIAASLLGVHGPAYTYTTTCASGSVAIGQAWMHLRMGVVDVALAGGHESALVEPVYAAYGDAGLLSDTTPPERSVTPWVGHSRNVFGEGAVTLVLETREHAEARGAPVLAELSAYGYANNGTHPTQIDGVGGRPAALLGRLFAQASLDPAQVAFVVGHGNGVQRSDVSEQNYMRRVFGPRANEVPLVSVKPIYGHVLGASSALNVAAAVLMVHHDYVVPTINIDESRIKRSTNHMPNRGAARPCPHGVAVSYGMGGNNTAVLVSKGAR